MPEVSGRNGRICVVGGAGFIGSHFIDALLQNPEISRVTIFDNFSSGRARHLQNHQDDARLRVLCGDALDRRRLKQAMNGPQLAIHLASNPDIARAATDPQIDFYQGTLLTQNVLEAARCAGVPRLLYASGSGVYGDQDETLLAEDSIPLRPISTYGASKLAGEALISSYCAMFGLTACIFRFANVVGARQTHGVGFDFIRRLMVNPKQLRILGDGRQSKSYIHVSDVVSALLHAETHCRGNFSIFNVATQDAITVTEIAELAVECLHLDAMPALDYTGGDRGWKGDVPVVRLNTDKIRDLGWT